MPIVEAKTTVLNGLTVTVLLTVVVHPFIVTAYDIALDPDATPVTIPVEEFTVAIPVEALDQTPPPVASAN